MKVLEILEKINGTIVTTQDTNVEFEGIYAVAYTHLTLQTICSV